MSLKAIRIIKKITALSSINILWFLCFTTVVNGETTNENNLKLVTQEQLKQVSSSNFKIAQTIFEQEQNLRSSTSNGEPFLRRQPTPGKPKFEPKRIPLVIPVPRQPYRIAPSITIVTPSGYGAAWGNVGIGIGLQARTRFREDADGVIGLGFGLGNPNKNIGAQIGINLVDVSAPFRDGGINLKLHRRLPSNFSVATGVQSFTAWGDTDGGSSIYGVVTKRFKLRQDRTMPFSELFTSVGIGGGQFRSESDINNGVNSVGVFGSLAVLIIEPIGFVTEWTGQDLTIGVPFVPFRKLSMTIIPAVTDITGSAGDGARFILGVGYSFSF